MSIYKVENDNEIKLILKGEKEILTFSGKSCAACRQIEKYLAELSKKYKEINFSTADVENFSSYTTNLGVTVLPTTFFIRNGEIIYTMFGSFSFNKIDYFINIYLF